MAIEKSFFSTYGWEVPDAYYKIDGWELINEETNEYNFQVKVFRNEHARTNDHAPLTINRMRMTIDTSTFSDSLSEENNFKTRAYSHLKNLTKSFRDDSKDV